MKPEKQIEGDPLQAGDDLWELLGKAPAPQVSPFFARNVLREVRQMQSERAGLFGYLRAHWRAASALACALVLSAGGIAIEKHQSDLQVAEKRKESSEIDWMAQRIASSKDYQVIAQLDELVDTERDAVWTDASAE